MDRAVPLLDKADPVDPVVLADLVVQDLAGWDFSLPSHSYDVPMFRTI